MTEAPPVEPKEEPADPPHGAAPRAAPQRDGKPERARARFPRWKKVLLAAAAGLLLLGLLLRLTAGPETAPAAAPGTGSTLVEGGTSSGSSGESGGSAWSPGLMALGFSFFVGFAVGTLLRVFVKIALVVVGLLFLLLTGLAYAELITVNWDGMEQIFQTFGERIGSDFEQVRTVVTGQLPQVGLGALGLFTGFKKR